MSLSRNRRRLARKANRVNSGEVDPNEVDLKDFFDVFIDAVSVFRGSAEYSHPQATYRGCAIDTPQGKRHCRRVGFITRQGLEVIVEIDFRQALLNPELYFDHLMEHLDKAMKEMNGTGNIIVMPEKKPLVTAVGA